MKKRTPQSAYMTQLKQSSAAPILKWAGGKTQLLPIIDVHYPEELKNNEIDTYVEPFIGGGSVFFDIYNRFQFQKAYLFDNNPELIILYNSVKEDVDLVIKELGNIEDEYLSKDLGAQEEFFYNVRIKYNQDIATLHKASNHNPFNAKRAALTIFLNRTCFNGLFRVNKSGAFNVPFGRYKNPTILFAEKLRAASEALKKATIKLSDFADSENYFDGKTFIYYDPPYRPINLTSSFTAYSKSSFGDSEQMRLSSHYKTLDSQGVLQLLSNSDPTNYCEDSFFDDLYHGFNICRVDAKRMINSNAAKRGNVRELLIRNY